MKPRSFRSISLAAAAVLLASAAAAVDTGDTLLLSEPAVSGSRIAFVYANDIWVAALARQHDLPVLSRDVHFDVVAGIRRISW